MVEGKRAGRTRVDLVAEGVHWDPTMSYGQYLAREPPLASQTSLTDEHDEMLFIVIHQVSELWLKQCLHEAHAAAGHIAVDKLRPAFKMLTRVVRIQEHMIQAWEVLATLTPADYSHFHDRLGSVRKVRF